ncbi:hypothetical protein SAMN04487988_102117 [Algoriphagus hitonicola]|uniref:Uncharacterized protein n=1 Tax=Algoriphagus hitonicola TaxID=435880 RepID=A0A1I2Q584_9BACT|nr:hypothetical protein SAMN04487988_102117 [Algoriphagus hitonicola]
MGGKQRSRGEKNQKDVSLIRVKKKTFRFFEILEGLIRNRILIIQVYPEKL